MSKIEFVSHEYFQDDLYTKEAVYLCLEGKYRVLYIRKESKTGGLFWSVPTVSITKAGKKEFMQVFMQDSTFLEKDIKDFLEKRSWESKNAVHVQMPIPFRKHEPIPFENQTPF